MSEIVYTHTETFARPSFSYDGNTRHPTDIKMTIFRSPGKVAMVTSTLVVGIPNHDNKDKRFYQWRTTSSEGLRRNSNGTIVPFSAHRKWDYRVGTPWTHRVASRPIDILSQDGVGWSEAGAYRAAVAAEFGVKSMYDVYPMSDEYGLISYRSMPSYLKNPMRAPNMQEYAARVFGKQRATQRLAMAALGTDPYIVALAHQFRGYVADEEIVLFMENNRFDEEMEVKYNLHTPFVRKFIQNMNEQSRLRLLHAGIDAQDMNTIGRSFAYSARAATLDRNRQYKSWHEVVLGY